MVGVCAYEERGQDQGLGEDGGTYIVELVSALREGGLATQMIREAHEGWAEGQGRTELQVHLGNRRALEYYGRFTVLRGANTLSERGLPHTATHRRTQSRPGP